MEIVDVGSLLVRDAVGVPDLRRFVGDVFLVERRRTGGLLLGESTLVALCGSRRSVRGGRGNVREEGLRIGPCCRAPNEIGSLPGEDIGKEVLGVAAVGDLLAVLVDPVVVELLLV